jgi:hypothetical protein
VGVLAGLQRELERGLRDADHLARAKQSHIGRWKARAMSVPDPERPRERLGDTRRGSPGDERPLPVTGRRGRWVDARPG